MGNKWGNSGRFYFIFGSQITADGDCSCEIKKTLTPWKESYDQPRQYIKKQRRYFANKGSSSQGYGFSSSHVWMWELDHKESWAPKNWCFWIVVLEKTLESSLECKEILLVYPAAIHGVTKSQIWLSDWTETERKSVLNIHWKDWCWSWNSNTLATWCTELTHWKRPWCWERLKAGGEGDNREWDGWMASLTRWTWVCTSSRSWWRTAKPGMPQSMGLQRVRHDWVNELNWTMFSLDFYINFTGVYKC